jgi:hypothetical protein
LILSFFFWKSAALQKEITMEFKNEKESGNGSGNGNESGIWKYGQKVYSLSSLRSGLIISINNDTNSLVINRGEKWGYETVSMRNITTDVEKILELLREQAQEYKESFFRVKNTLQQVQTGR